MRHTDALPSAVEQKTLFIASCVGCRICSKKALFVCHHVHSDICFFSFKANFHHFILLTVFAHLLTAVYKSYLGSTVRSKSEFYEANSAVYR